MAEGEIAAEDIVKELNRSDITENAFSQSTADEYADKLTDERIKEYNEYLRREDKDTIFSTEELEEAMQVLIEHLKARKETRWHSFAENLDYPEKSDEWLKYVNTRKVDGRIEVKYRNLVGRGETYEHSN